MKTLMKRMIAGSTLAVLTGAFNGCAPTYVASRPRPVIVDPEPVYYAPPVQTVVVTPQVPVWAPPYAYVSQVHYYYFPDYMVYYDVFGNTYCYYNGYNWLNVAVLPGLPMYYGFNPYNTYIVVLNRSCYNPWTNHTYYTDLYPSGYYQTAYAPRTSLGSNTVLRAYDENQGRPLFVDKRSNKEVAVKYDVRQAPRTAMSSNNTDRNVDANATDRDTRHAADLNTSKRSERTAVTIEKDSRTNSSTDIRTNATERNTNTGLSDRRSEIQSTKSDNRKDTRGMSPVIESQKAEMRNDKRETDAVRESQKPARVNSTTLTEKESRKSNEVKSERTSAPARNTVVPERKPRNEEVKSERNTNIEDSKTIRERDAKSESLSPDKTSRITR